MIPWQQVDTARVPGADVELRLMRRGADFSMMLGQNELMSSRLSGSEEALATLTCRRIEAVKRPHLLIGGWDSPSARHLPCWEARRGSWWRSLCPP